MTRESKPKLSRKDKYSQTLTALHLFRMLAALFAIVSFVTTFQGFRGYVFEEHAILLPAMLSLAIQAVLLIFNLNIIDFLKRLSPPNYKDHRLLDVLKMVSSFAIWVVGIYIFVLGLLDGVNRKMILITAICCMVSILLGGKRIIFALFYAFTLTISSTFSFVFICNLIYSETRYTDANITLDNTYRGYLAETYTFATEEKKLLKSRIDENLNDIQRNYKGKDKLPLDKNSKYQSALELKKKLEIEVQRLTKAQDKAQHEVDIISASKAPDAYRKAVEQLEDSQKRTDVAVKSYNNQSEYVKKLENTSFSETVSVLRMSSSSKEIQESLKTLDLFVAENNDFTNNMNDLRTSFDDYLIILELLGVENNDENSEDASVGEQVDNTDGENADSAPVKEQVDSTGVPTIGLLQKNLITEPEIPEPDTEENDNEKNDENSDEDVDADTEQNDDENEDLNGITVSEWKHLWNERFSALEHNIKALPICLLTEEEKKADNPNYNIDVLSSFDYQKISSNIALMKRDNLSEINVMEKAWYYLRYNTYRTMAVVSLIFAFAIDLIPFVAGIFIYFIQYRVPDTRNTDAYHK